MAWSDSTNVVRGNFVTGHDWTVTQRMIPMDNMDYSRNWRVSYGVVWYADSENGAISFPNEAHQLVVATNFPASLPQPGAGGAGTQNQTDASNYSQIAWANLQSYAAQTPLIVDPLHVITEDMFIQCWSFNTSGNPVAITAGLNYMIVLEALDGEKVGLMGIIRQSDANNASI